MIRELAEIVIPDNTRFLFVFKAWEPRQAQQGVTIRTKLADPLIKKRHLRRYFYLKFRASGSIQSVEHQPNERVDRVVFLLLWRENAGLFKLRYF